MHYSLVVSFCLIFLSQCKSIHVTNRATLHDTEAVDPVQELARVCVDASRLLAIDTNGTVRYRVTESGADSLYQSFFDEGTAKHEAGFWQLSLSFGSSAPTCTRHLTRLSQREFLAALGCIDGAAVCAAAAPRAAHAMPLVLAAKALPANSMQVETGKGQAEHAFALNTQPFQPTLRYKKDDCEDFSKDYHVFKLTSDRQTVKCAQDTLYTWGPALKTTYLRTYVEKHGDQPFFWRTVDGKVKKSPVFSTISPSGSFGYGLELVRIRLKKGVHFKPIDRERGNLGNPYLYCDELSEAQARNTVLVRYFEEGGSAGMQLPDGRVALVRGKYSGLDFILCGPGPIDSISSGTKRISDEFFSDQRRATCSMIYLPQQWYYWSEFYYKFNGVDIMLDINLDSQNNTDWSVDALDKKIFHMFDTVRSKTGFIAYNPTGSRSETFHLQTDYPTHFNPPIEGEVPTREAELKELEDIKKGILPPPPTIEDCAPYMK